MVLMLAGQQPIEIPLDARHRTVRNRSPAQNARRRLARVRVPAGAFTAETFRVGRTRVWRSPAVPLWGLVKARSSRQSIELLASGAAGGHSVFPPGWAQGNGSESAK
jgi:hypothetical protein